MAEIRLYGFYVKGVVQEQSQNDRNGFLNFWKNKKCQEYFPFFEEEYDILKNEFNQVYKIEVDHKPFAGKIGENIEQQLRDSQKRIQGINYILLLDRIMQGFNPPPVGIWYTATWEQFQGIQVFTTGSKHRLTMIMLSQSYF